jgi:NADH dehydrogenase [ubiquinone] 1 alpha subcomplex assembly factor 4
MIDLGEMGRRVVDLTLRVSKRLYGYFLVRPAQRYNVENRAMKLLDKIEKSEKPVVTAPKHPPTEKYLMELIQKHPEIMENVKKPAKEIIEGVKQIKIKTTVVPYEYNVREESNESKSMARQLPERRQKLFLAEMGVKDPDRVPVGKVSLREAVQLIKAHGSEPENYTAEKIAKVHDLQLHDVENVLDHFKPYFYYYPTEPTNVKHKAPWYTPMRLTDIMLSDSSVYEVGRLKQLEAEKKQLEDAKEEEREQEKGSNDTSTSGNTNAPQEAISNPESTNNGDQQDKNKNTRKT